jgi:PrtD family type I secretion system ABC transporter
MLAEPILRAVITRRGGSQSSQAMREFDSLRQTITGAGVLALFDAPWTPVYIGLCFLLNPLLGAMALFGSTSLVMITLLNERATRPRLEKANQAAGLSYASQSQSAAMHDVIRAMGMSEAMVKRHEAERVTVTVTQAEASFAAGGYLSLTRFIRISLQSMGLGVAAYLAVEQQISLGAIFATSLLISRALSPIEQVLGSWRSLTEAHSAYGRLSTLLAKDPTETPKTLLPVPAGNVVAQRISVSEPGSDRALLQDVSFAMAPGQVLGVVGASGAGKTTLLRALVGAQPLSQGRIRVDLADTADWDAERLGRHVGYLPQDIGLFQGTVKQNICRFRDGLGESLEVLDAKVVTAAKAAGAHEMILRLPHGYDTMLNWGGEGVSLGQAQRIGLARALFDDPVVVALDEPNAHLDGEGEHMLVRALEHLRARGAAVILVAHRASLLPAMDRLLVLADGRMALFGDRDEVLRRLNTRPGQAPAAPPALSPGEREVA